MSENNAIPWQQFARRYAKEDWRSPIFYDMVSHDIRRLGSPLTMLDIGCGYGFDGVADLQASLAEHATRFIGIEPDETVSAPACCDEFHHCYLEDAPLTAASVDLAFAVFVLEHLPSPRRFWNKLAEVLSEGGVFWGFTVDARNYYAVASQLAGHLKFKDWYLNRFLGQRGDRYKNYPTSYRANTPRQIRRHTRAFRKREFLSLHRVGQLDCITPRRLHFATHFLDRLHLLARLPGANLVVRLEK